MDNNEKINAHSDTIDVRALWFRYAQKWYWFVFAVLISLTLSWLYLKTQDTKYEVQTTIMLRNENASGTVDQAALMQSMGLFNTSKALDDEIQVINSYKIIKQAVDSLDLYTEYFEKQGLKYVELYPATSIRLVVPKHLFDTLKSTVEIEFKVNQGSQSIKLKTGESTYKYQLSHLQEPFNTPIGQLKIQTTGQIADDERYKIKIYPSKVLVNSYSSRMRIGAANKQSMNVIKISIVESNTQKAQELLDKIVELYNLDAIIDKNIVATATAGFLDNQLDKIKAELSGVESNVEKYKKSNNITDISSEASLYLQSSSEYNKKLAEIENQSRLIQYIENHIKNNKNRYSSIPANIGIEDSAIEDAIKTYNTVVLERMRLLNSSNPSNPVLMGVEEQINEMRSNILVSINSVKGGLAISKNAIMQKEGEFKSRIKAVPTQEREYLEIKRQQEIMQNLYIFLYQKRIENALKLASTASAARTIDKAYASLSPVAPKRSVVYLMALILGVLLPFIFIYVRDLINNKIESPKEFKKAVRVPYLGNVCVSRETERVVVQEGKVTSIVEMFRLIRTNLQFMVSSKKSPIILITSSISGEGKSFISINLAMSFALMKKKVVLIGMDIRNPMLGEYLHIPKKNGLTLYLSDNSLTKEKIIVPSGFHTYLDVIPAGPVPPNPSELLMSPRLDALIAELKEVYDYIIVDSAPVGIVSDTYLLTRFIDNSVFVARQDYTTTESCQLINDIYDKKTLKDMGVILNGTTATSNYGYGYGYGSDYRRKQSRKLAPRLSLGEKISDIFEAIKIKRTDK